ncbi:MAG: hypothetical protein F7B17_01100 [Desulfurococcales archaeon]|nr:hypothetical protein [Desulfurococcales archaeon]
MPRRPVEALMELVRTYARVRSGVVAILEASGQDRFKIHVRSLYKVSGRVETGYSMVDDILKEVERNPEALRELEALGVRIVREGRDTYVEVPARLLIDAAREVSERKV